MKIPTTERIDIFGWSEWRFCFRQLRWQYKRRAKFVQHIKINRSERAKIKGGMEGAYEQKNCSHFNSVKINAKWEIFIGFRDCVTFIEHLLNYKLPMNQCRFHGYWTKYVFVRACEILFAFSLVAVCGCVRWMMWIWKYHNIRFGYGQMHATIHHFNNLLNHPAFSIFKFILVRYINWMWFWRKIPNEVTFWALDIDLPVVIICVFHQALRKFHKFNKNKIDFSIMATSSKLKYWFQWSSKMCARVLSTYSIGWVNRPNLIHDLTGDTSNNCNIRRIRAELYWFILNEFGFY